MRNCASLQVAMEKAQLGSGLAKLGLNVGSDHIRSIQRIGGSTALENLAHFSNVVNEPSEPASTGQKIAPRAASRSKRETLTRAERETKALIEHCYVPKTQKTATIDSGKRAKGAKARILASIAQKVDGDRYTWKKLFSKFDRSGTGRVTAGSFRKALDSIGIQTGETDFNTLVDFLTVEAKADMSTSSSRGKAVSTVPYASESVWQQIDGMANTDTLPENRASKIDARDEINYSPWEGNCRTERTTAQKREQTRQKQHNSRVRHLRDQIIERFENDPFRLFDLMRCSRDHNEAEATSIQEQEERNLPTVKEFCTILQADGVRVAKDDIMQVLETEVLSDNDLLDQRKIDPKLFLERCVIQSHPKFSKSATAAALGDRLQSLEDSLKRWEQQSETVRTKLRRKLLQLTTSRGVRSCAGTGTGISGIHTTGNEDHQIALEKTGADRNCRESCKGLGREEEQALDVLLSQFGRGKMLSQPAMQQAFSNVGLQLGQDDLDQIVAALPANCLVSAPTARQQQQQRAKLTVDGTKLLDWLQLTPSQLLPAAECGSYKERSGQAKQAQAAQKEILTVLTRAQTGEGHKRRKCRSLIGLPVLEMQVPMQREQQQDGASESVSLGAMQRAFKKLGARVNEGDLRALLRECGCQCAAESISTADLRTFEQEMNRRLKSELASGAGMNEDQVFTSLARGGKESVADTERGESTEAVLAIHASDPTTIPAAAPPAPIAGASTALCAWNRNSSLLPHSQDRVMYDRSEVVESLPSRQIEHLKAVSECRAAVAECLVTADSSSGSAAAAPKAAGSAAAIRAQVTRISNTRVNVTHTPARRHYMASSQGGISCLSGASCSAVPASAASDNTNTALATSSDSMPQTKQVQGKRTYVGSGCTNPALLEGVVEFHSPHHQQQQSRTLRKCVSVAVKQQQNTHAEKTFALLQNSNANTGSSSTSSDLKSDGNGNRSGTAWVVGRSVPRSQQRKGRKSAALTGTKYAGLRASTKDLIEHAHAHPHLLGAWELHRGRKGVGLSGTKYAALREHTKALLQHDYDEVGSAVTDGAVGERVRDRKAAPLTGSKYAAKRAETKNLFEGRYAEGDASSGKREKKAATLTGTKYATKKEETRALMEHRYAPKTDPCLCESSSMERSRTKKAVEGEAKLYSHTALWGQPENSENEKP